MGCSYVNYFQPLYHFNALLKYKIKSITFLNPNSNQLDSLVCIYVAVGQKKSTTASLARLFRENLGKCSRFILVNASAADTCVNQFVAPFTGCTFGEFFRDLGLSSLLIYDDLGKQAMAYRQLCLLMRRPPGREAYPGDVFYLHSRLLERAGKLSEIISSGGSLTAFPIIETQSGDVSAYIATNVISITDGQLYLEAELFYKGIKPSLSYGLSVSRIGTSAQHPFLRQHAGRIKLELAQYRAVELLSQIDGELDETTKFQIIRGESLVDCFKQDQYAPLPILYQMVMIIFAMNGLFDQLGTHNRLWLKKIICFQLSHTKRVTELALNHIQSLLVHKFSSISVSKKKKLASIFLSKKCSYRIKDDNSDSLNPV
jgi:proton translocating ATP synthase F1 alpha subunit